MILTSSVPIVWSSVYVSKHLVHRCCRPTTTLGRTGTYILRAGSLQIHSAREQLLQYWEHAVALETSLQAAQKLQIELHIPPLSLSYATLNSIGQLGEQLVDEVRLLNVDDENHGSHKRRLQGLLERQLEAEVHKVIAEQGIVVVLAHEISESLYLLVPWAHRVLGNGDEPSADSDMGRDFVHSAALAAASIALVVIIW